MPLKIEPWRPPGAGEVEMAAVVALYRQALARKVPPEERTAVSARAQLAELLAVPRTGMLLAKGVGEKPEGLLIVRYEPPSVRIVFMGARELRRGTGRALVDALREIAAQKGAADLRVAFAERDARARGFFSALGFRPVPSAASGGEAPAEEERMVEARFALPGAPAAPATPAR